MFLLHDLPTRKTLVRIRKRYPNLNPESVGTVLSLMRIGSDLLELLDGRLLEHNLLHGRWITLILLMRNGWESQPSMLAEQQGVSRATMTGLLDVLEREGFVVRTASEKDSRQKLVKITARGRRLLDRTLPSHYDWGGGMLTHFTSAEKKELARLLEKFRENLVDASFQ